jgi:hypothetical protein
MQGGKSLAMTADNGGHGLISTVNTEAHPTIQVVPQLWQEIYREDLAQEQFNVNCSYHR